MLDDKSKRGQADRSRASASKPYEVAYFAKKHGISSEDAKPSLCGTGQIAMLPTRRHQDSSNCPIQISANGRWRVSRSACR